MEPQRSPDHHRGFYFTLWASLVASATGKQIYYEALKHHQCLFENRDDFQVCTQTKGMVPFHASAERERRTEGHPQMKKSKDLILDMWEQELSNGSNAFWLLQPSTAKTTYRFTSGENKCTDQEQQHSVAWKKTISQTQTDISGSVGACRTSRIRNKKQCLN